MLTRKEDLGWDDILIFPVLRNLTMVKDLAFPEGARHYLEKIASLTQTHTYFN